MIDAGVVTSVTAESVHFASVDELDAAREELLRMINVFETGDEVTDEESLMRVMSATLRFPEEFGRNWDAMVDGLRGVDCNGARRGLVLLLHHARRLWNGAPEVAGQLVEVWLSVAEERRAHDEPFHLVFVW